MAQIIVLTDPTGRKIGFNVAHVIAFTANIDRDAYPEVESYIHTSVGADARGWSEWMVVESFDEIVGLLQARSIARDGEGV